MRAEPPIVLLLLASLLAVVPTGAAAEPLLTDAAGDAAVDLPSPAPDVPVSGMPNADNVDLLALALDETEDALRFTVAVAKLGGAQSGGEYDVYFTWNRQPFLLTMLHYDAGETLLGGTWSFARLYVGDADGGWSMWAGFPAQVDAAAGTIAADVQKIWVLDRQERPPGQGDSITDIHVEATRRLVDMGGFITMGTRTADTMGADAPATYVLQRGDFARGTLALNSEDRVRVSNGGATTFVFRVELSNTAETDDEYRLAIVDLPTGWNATVQSPIVVPAKSERTVAVLASVPFAHDHGGFSSFNLTVASARDAGTEGRMRLGVLHTPIPQPAGHHNELFLHAPRWQGATPLESTFQEQFPWSWVHMNTLPDHERDLPDVLPNGRDDGASVWTVWLSPSLRMGLDFDVDKTGTLEGAIVRKVEGEGTVSARLWYYNWDADEEILLAESEPQSISIPRDAPAPFSLVMTPTPESDYIPYTRSQNMMLEISLDGGDEFGFFWGGPTEPRLQTEAFKLTLPLREYHDRLSGDAVATAALGLVAEGPVEKAARPGSVATYQFLLTNKGSSPLTIDVDVAGGDAAWGSVVPDAPVALAPGETKRVTLGVSVPRESAEGQELEVLVFAHALEDPSQSVVARTKTVVTLGSDAVPDEREVLLAARQSENDTPAAGALAGIAALAGVAALLRRRA